MQKGLLEEYNKLNKSYGKKLVFRLGMESGFFSEFNNMVIAMLYCLQHKIQFVLYSAPANFGYEKGWEDYFLPFCKEVGNDFHRRYNHRYPGAYFSRWERLKFIFYKTFYRFDYFTHELWYSIRDKDAMENAHYNIPQLGIDGDLRSACSVLAGMIWRLNEKTKAEINELVAPLHLPPRYVGIHIRRGDKSSESDFLSTARYMEVIGSKTEIKNVFVATDDYAIYEELTRDYPGWNFVTLSTPKDKGFFYNEYASISAQQKKEHMITLLATVDTLAHADLFAGTFSSNIGMFLGMVMPVDRCIGIDYDTWLMW